jgi:hypothetical protein
VEEVVVAEQEQALAQEVAPLRIQQVIGSQQLHTAICPIFSSIQRVVPILGEAYAKGRDFTIALRN